ncbi:hypothetical protein PG989_010271 [Apiospora arundinis]
METFFTLATLREQLKTILGFSDIESLNTWLDSDGVKPYKDEFIADYLSHNRAADDADYAKVTNLMGVNAIMNFVVYNATSTPDKTGWSPEKHWVRFIWQMGWYAKTHQESSAWKAPRDEDMEIWFWHGYEVVKFLKAEYNNDRDMEEGN